MLRFLVDVCIALTGAAWGAGLTVATVAFLLGASGPNAPLLLTVGLLGIIGDSELLPGMGAFLCVVAAFYGTLAILLWRCVGSHRTRIAATLLYGSLPLGLVYGAVFPDRRGYAWTDLSLEIRHFESAATVFPVLFPVTAVALMAWHSYALWQLFHAWTRPMSPRASFRLPRSAD